MKKTLRMIGMTLVAILLSVNFSACSSDDDEPADPSTHDPALLGTWVNHEEGYDWSEDVTVTFNANGSYSIINDYWDEEDGKERLTQSGSWSTSDDILTIHVEKSNDPDEIGMTGMVNYSVQGNRLILDGDEVFTRK